MAWREDGTRRELSSAVRGVSQYRVSVQAPKQRHQAGLLDVSSLTGLDVQTAKGPVIGYVGLSNLS